MVRAGNGSRAPVGNRRPRNNFNPNEGATGLTTGEAGNILTLARTRWGIVSIWGQPRQAPTLIHTILIVLAQRALKRLDFCAVIK